MNNTKKKGMSAPLKPLDETQRKLVEDNLNLATVMSKQYASVGVLRGVPVEDLQQDACVGLCIAAQSYDPSKGADFRTYAFGWCRKYILQALKDEALLPFEDLDEGADIEEMTRAIDVIDDDADMDEDPVLRVAAYLEVLGQRERRVVGLVYGIACGQPHRADRDRVPMSFKEIADQLHLHPETVRRIYHQAMAKIEHAAENL